MGEKVTPYQGQGSKKEQVAQMFDNIAHSYDFLNHFFSLGIDRIWRRKCVRILSQAHPKKVLDVATGTGDFALATAKRIPDCEVTGIDIAVKMVEIGNKKAAKKGLQERVKLYEGDSEDLQFDDQSFDAYTVAFGVRNFENLEKGLREMHRVLKSGGRGVILEFSKPKSFPMKQLFSVYFKFIMPTVGKLVSKDSRAYTYLPESVDAFPEREDLVAILEKCGYKNCSYKTLSGGIACMYLVEK